MGSKAPFLEARPRGTNIQRAGLRYELAVLLEIGRRFPSLLVQPWIEYRDSTGLRSCCPDGLLLLPDHVTVIVEVKLTHTSDAYWQLERQYRPVVERLCPKDRIAVLEVCRTFDPHVRLPVPQLVVRDLEAYLAQPLGTYGVWRWAQR